MSLLQSGVLTVLPFYRDGSGSPLDEVSLAKAWKRLCEVLGARRDSECME